LFRKALDRYQTGPMSFLTEALRKPTARAVVEAIFSGFIRMQRDRNQARGCLIVSGGTRVRRRGRDGAPRVGPIEASDRYYVSKAVRAGHRGRRPAGRDDCATLARYVATVLNGLAVQAASGTTAKELRLVAALAMQAWPS